jgi:hypothetical protein
MSESIAALFKTLTQGVYLIGVAHGEERNAFTAAWVMQVSFDPVLLALSINPLHSSYRLLKEGDAFSVNVLKQEQLDLAARFGDPAREDALSETEWTTGRLGVPVSTASCWIRAPSPSAIAIPATWTALPRCSPTRSGNHEELDTREPPLRASSLFAARSAAPRQLTAHYLIVMASPLRSAFAISPTCRPASSRTAPF